MNFDFEISRVDCTSVYSILLFYPITLEGCRGTTDEFATIPFHLDLFSAALVELAKYFCRLVQMDKSSPNMKHIKNGLLLVYILLIADILPQLHSEWPKLQRVLAVLSAIGLKDIATSDIIWKI